MPRRKEWIECGGGERSQFAGREGILVQLIDHHFLPVLPGWFLDVCVCVISWTCSVHGFGGCVKVLAVG